MVEKTIGEAEDQDMPGLYLGNCVIMVEGSNDEIFSKVLDYCSMGGAMIFDQFLPEVTHVILHDITPGFLNY